MVICFLLILYAIISASSIKQKSIKKVNLEFITLDKNTGKNNFRRQNITPSVLRQIQTETAEILDMQRGQDKRKSGAKRIEPRAYARIKEQEKANLKKQKASLEAKLSDLSHENQKLISTLTQAKENATEAKFDTLADEKKRQLTCMTHWRQCVIFSFTT